MDSRSCLALFTGLELAPILVLRGERQSQDVRALLPLLHPFT